MRVAFTNNYSMTLARAEIAADLLPRQHLYGADALERAGADVRTVDAPAAGTWSRLSRAAGGRLGDLGQEAAVVSLRSRDLVSYGAEPGSLSGLALARAAGVWRHPIVAVVHQLPRRSVRMRGVFRGIDVLLCLSTFLRDQLVGAFDRAPGSVRFAPWGPALDYAGYQLSGESAGVVSSGKTNRDQPTLLEALRQVAQPARVYARTPDGLPDLDGVELVTDVTHEDRHRPPGAPRFSYRHVLDDLAEASVVAIPLRDPRRVSGLSELNDALAMGKPVVATRSPYLQDVDLEGIGCGIWVDAGDVDGWGKALSRLQDPDLRLAMGRRGREFAERAWNTETWGSAVVEACTDVLRVSST